MFEFSGTVSSHVKTVALQQKADKTIHNYGQPEEKVGYDYSMRALDTRVSAITARLKRGATLSYSEMSYLREKSPELYAKAVRVMAERKAFAARLKSSRSKEEARSTRIEKISSIACTNTSGDPVEQMEQHAENTMRIHAVDGAYSEYLRSAHYRKLVDKTSKKDRLTKLFGYGIH